MSPTRAVRDVVLVDAARTPFGKAGANGLYAETRADEHEPLRADVVEHVTHAIGIPPGDVVLVAPGTLPKTSSGKLQRSLCRSRYAEGVFADA